jgi:predicted lipoprotein with Yx(FWY)xxD motif
MSKFTGRRLLVAAGLSAAALVLSACDTDTGGYGSGSNAAADAGSTAASAAAPADAAGATGGLVAVDSPQLGQIVTDSGGRTLYRFDKDTNKPSATHCTDACAAKWPPVVVQGKPELNGVGSALVGSVARPDGTMQVTLNGWPLYRFAGDTAAGQANGQGVGGTWFASTPEGKKAQGTGKAAAPAAPSQAQSGY